MTDSPATPPVRVAIDAMSGDNGLEAVVAAVSLCLQRHDDVTLTLVGDQAQLRQQLDAAGLGTEARLSITHSSEVVLMDELPSRALRAKKDSSMRVAINLVHRGDADAAVSAGNTGALMAIARFVLKTLPGIDRPAIVSALPAKQGHTYLLDLGANAACTPEHLFEFAVMGSVLARAVDGRESPRVATTGPVCWGCAAWSSSRTAAPMPWPSPMRSMSRSSRRARGFRRASARTSPASSPRVRI